MATLAVWKDLPEQLDKALSVLSLKRRSDDDSKPYALEQELARVLRQLAHYRAEDAIPDSTWEETLDRALEESEKARVGYRMEFAKREGIRSWWHEQVKVEGDQLATTHGGLEELRKLIADWSFDEAVKMRGEPGVLEQIKQARKAAAICPLRSADTGRYECPAFPDKNQDGNGDPES